LSERHCVSRRLVQRRVLSRRADPGDARRALFSLTPLGRSLDRLRSGTVEAVISRALRRFRPAEVAVAERVLSRLARALEREAARGPTGRRRGPRRPARRRAS